MGKRSDFPRFPQDRYDTPLEAAAPLLPHLEPGVRIRRALCGAGRLIGHLKRADHVLVGAYDLPDDARVKRYAESRTSRLHNQLALGPRRSAPDHHQFLRSGAGVVVARH